MRRLAYLTLLTSACTMGTTFDARNESYDDTGDEPFVFVSLCSLITDPDKFHKKNVRLIAVLDLQAEGDKLCLHKEDVKYGATSKLPFGQH